MSQSKEVELGGCSFMLLLAILMLCFGMAAIDHVSHTDDLRAIQRALDAYGIVDPEGER